MKTLIRWMTMAAVLAANPAAWAAIDFTGSVGSGYSASWSGSQGIPDNNASGVSYALNFNDASADHVATASLTFTVDGGWNGDLYAYLSHGSSLVVLLNRVGRSDANPDGSSASGFSAVTLGSAYATDIHTASSTYGQATTGNYAPDGRNILPGSTGLDFDNASRNATFNTLLGNDPNGGWTLFFADVAPGASGTLTGWNLDVTTAPEPVNVALGIFAAAAGLTALVRRRVRNLRARKTA